MNNKIIAVLTVITIVIFAAVVFVIVETKDKNTEYLVTFSYEDGKANEVVVKDGDLISEPEKPLLEGYTFLGWYKNGKLYDFSVPIKESITLVARYEKLDENKDKKEYEIKFDTDGGSDITEQKILEGEQAVRPSDPVKAGYTFSGWILNGSSYDFNLAVKSNITLKAEWKKIEYVTITFNTDGGNNITSQVIEKGKKVDKPTNPTKSGYTFSGWTLNGNTFSFASVVNENITLKAIWKEETSTTKLSLLGDVNGDGVVNAKDITILMRYISADIEFSAQERLTADVNKDGDIDYIDICIIRKYLVNDIKSLPYDSGNKYTVTYNLDGGKFENVNGDLCDVYANVCLPYTLPEPTKAGYVFMGWTGSNGSSPQKVVEIAKGTTGNLTYTANWILLGDVDGDGKITARDERDLERYVAWHTELTSQGLLVADLNNDGVIDNVDATILANYLVGDVVSLPYDSGEKYTITYNLDGGKFESGEEEWCTVYAENLRYSLSITPTKNGYVFVGWTGSNGTTPQTAVEIAKGTTGNLTYTANWRAE